MNRAMTEEKLIQETQMHRGTGGISAENRSLGFRPAFMDQETCAVPSLGVLAGVPSSDPSRSAVHRRAPPFQRTHRSLRSGERSGAADARDVPVARTAPGRRWPAKQGAASAAGRSIIGVCLFAPRSP